MMEEGHYLTSYLNHKLPALGLDAETYGPYLTGAGSLFYLDDYDVKPAAANDDDDDDCANAADDDIDEDELDSVLGLLQASSETHEDDTGAFVELKTELLERRRQYMKQFKQQKKQEQERQKVELQKQHQEELKKAQQLQKEKEEERLKHLSNQSEEQRLAKLKLVEQYGYEKEDEEHDASTNKEADGDDANGSLNKVNLSAMEKEKREAMKQQSAEQKNKNKEATKQAKLAKEQAKEERRKKAQKGERRR